MCPLEPKQYSGVVLAVLGGLLDIWHVILFLYPLLARVHEDTKKERHQVAKIVMAWFLVHFFSNFGDSLIWSGMILEEPSFLYSAFNMVGSVYFISMPYIQTVLNKKANSDASRAGPHTTAPSSVV